MPPKQKRKDHPSSASITSSSTTSSAKSARTAPELADDESMALDQQIAVAMDEIRSAAYRADVDDKKFWQGQLTALQALKTEKMKQKTLLRETNLAEMPPEHLSLFAKLEWSVSKSIDGTGVSMKAVEHRGTSHGDQGKVAGTKLFDGHLFSSREPMFAEMVQYLNNLPHLAGKQVGFGVVLASPGAGKSFMLQRAYNVALAHDQCTLRLLFGYNHNMNTDAGALHHLASRVLFTYFCGYPSVQVDSILTRIGKLVDRLFRNAMTTDVVKQVIDLLEADFASHRSLEPSAVRTIFFVDEAREERVLVGQERTVQSDVRATLDNAVGRRGAIFTALQMYGPESKNHPLWWFAVEPLPVHNDDVFAAKVLNALGKFANVDSRLPVVMLALALTGGHARTVEVMIQLLNERATIADSDIVAVMGQVRARLTVEYGDRIPFVQRWFVASLLGANFRFGAVDQNYPLDAARAAGDVINASAATRRDDGLPTRVVPEVSLLRLGALVTGATGVAQLFKFLMMPDRLLASRTNAIVLEELVVASLSLKMGLIYNASTERPTTENERLWWPVPFIGASSDRVRLFSDGEALALLPCPRRTAPIVRAPAECAIYDEVSLGGRGETRIFHINESIWADEWSVYTATGEFDAFAYGFASTSSRWVVDAPVLVYSALSNQAAIDAVLLYKNAKGDPRALMMQMKFSEVDATTRFALDPIIKKCKTHITLSKPLRDFGIVDLSQITVCIMAHAKVSAARELAVKCKAHCVGFHVVLLEPDQLRQFFGPSLMQLPFFNKAHGAESLWSDMQIALQDAQATAQAAASSGASHTVLGADCD